MTTTSDLSGLSLDELYETIWAQEEEELKDLREQIRQLEVDAKSDSSLRQYEAVETNSLTQAVDMIAQHAVHGYAVHTFTTTSVRTTHDFDVQFWYTALLEKERR